MTLTNPTDDQLNAAFAERVAGIKDAQYVTGRGMVYSVRTERGLEERRVPNYCVSADAVLPHISKLKEVGIHYLNGDWFVRCWSEDKNCANCESFPKACVIALLRAHGVGVEINP